MKNEREGEIEEWERGTVCAALPCIHSIAALACWFVKMVESRSTGYFSCLASPLINYKQYIVAQRIRFTTIEQSL